jgi:hypothetical protein
MSGTQNRYGFGFENVLTLNFLINSTQLSLGVYTDKTCANTYLYAQ